MSIILVKYPIEEWLDVLSFEGISYAIANENELITKIISLPRCENWEAIATCRRTDSKIIEISWEEHETNTKNDIDLGVLELCWIVQSDVLVTAPDSAHWRGKNGYETYPVVTHVRGMDL